MKYDDLSMYVMIITCNLISVMPRDRGATAATRITKCNPRKTPITTVSFYAFLVTENSIISFLKHLIAVDNKNIDTIYKILFQQADNS